MIEDLRTAPDGQVLEADICIVGAGPAGVALATALQGSGLQTIVFESGGLSLETASQDLSIAENIGLPHGGAANGRARVFGGAGRLWAGQCVRLDSIDFEPRSWVPLSGWPIKREALEPFYEAAERFFRIEHQPTDESAYRLFKLEAPVWSLDTIESMFTVYTNEVDIGRFHQAALKHARNVDLVLHANLVHVDTEGPKITGLRLRALDGRTAFARAQVYVLCAGGIENARLLLASDEQRPAGLGNARDLVGRYFQEHPNGLTAMIEGGDPVSLQNRFRMLYGNYKFFPKFRISESAQRARQVLNANAHLRFMEAEDSGVAALRAFVQAARRRKLPPDTLRHLLALIWGTGEIGRVVLARARGGSVSWTPSEIRLQCYLEQSPNPDSRIRLGRERDSLGMRRATIDWRLSEIERRTAQVMTDLVAKEFSRLGLGHVYPDLWLQEQGEGWKKQLTDCYHHAGTTRMTIDPSEGVVDFTLEVFDVPGLYVCGSSVFPTSGYANPTLTVVALAFRLADHLRKKLGAN